MGRIHFKIYLILYFRSIVLELNLFGDFYSISILIEQNKQNAFLLKFILVVQTKTWQKYKIVVEKDCLFNILLKGPSWNHLNYTFAFMTIMNITKYSLQEIGGNYLSTEKLTRGVHINVQQMTKTAETVERN